MGPNKEIVTAQGNNPDCCNARTEEIQKCQPGIAGFLVGMNNE